MDPSIIHNNTALRETFLLGQVFVLSSFALRANSIGHLEQIDSYAPGHQISFGNLNYVADIRGDLCCGERSNFKKIPTYTQDHGDA